MSFFNIKVTELQLENSSLIYKDQTKEEEEFNKILKRGYLKEIRPKLNQSVLVGLVDGFNKLVSSLQTQSEQKSDPSYNLLSNFWDDLKTQFQDLNYFVVDNEQCISEFLTEARSKGVNVITRLSESSQTFKEIINQYPETSLEPILKQDNFCVFGRFCGTTQIAGEEVKLLLISNHKNLSNITKIINTRARLELKDVSYKIKKLYTQPKACKKDAQDELFKIFANLKYCSVQDISFIEVLKNVRRGRPSKDTEVDKKLVAVKVKANVSINQFLVDQAIKNELKFIIATTDTQRQWQMQDLYSSYIKQSIFERNWIANKKQQVLIDTIYLHSPTRINALMWISTLALLVCAVASFKQRSSK